MKNVQVYKSGGSSLTLKINTVKLESLSKALGLKYHAEVGILADSSHNRKAVPPRKATERTATGKGRPGDNPSTLTNVEIGKLHEYGSKTRNIPARSFLWMPLSMHLMDAVNAKSGVINKYLNMAQVHKCYELLGIVGENVVQEAFKTGGFGTWPKLSPVTIARKGSDKILIDTAQLRKSITSRVAT